MTQQTLNRHYYKRIGICPYCRRNKLYGEEGSCPECRAKNTEYKRKKDKKHYNRVHAEWSMTYNDRKEKGICVRCGKRNAKEGYVRCERCMKKDEAARHSRNFHLSRYERGLCRWCDNPVEDGYRVCEYHHQMNIERARKRVVNDDGL